MGNDAQVLRKIRIGQLQGGAFTAGGLGERYGALNLYGIPFLFGLARRDRCRARGARCRDRGGSRSRGFRDVRFHRGRVRESLVERAHQQCRRHAAQEGLGAGGRRHQLPLHGGAGPFAVRAARDRRLDGAADGAHRHHVRVARRGARAAMAHEGQVHHGAADLVLDGRLRDRESVYTALSAEDQQVVREVMGRYIQGSIAKRATTTARRPRSSRGPGRRRSRSTPRMSTAGARRSRAFIRSCGHVPISMRQCSTAFSPFWPSTGARIPEP